jgi:antitoxin component of RelBE/YafQ-DinJ toxin-antitoxin module
MDKSAKNNTHTLEVEVEGFNNETNTEQSVVANDQYDQGEQKVLISGRIDTDLSEKAKEIESTSQSFADLTIDTIPDEFWENKLRYKFKRNKRKTSFKKFFKKSGINPEEQLNTVLDSQGKGQEVPIENSSLKKQENDKTASGFNEVKKYISTSNHLERDLGAKPKTRFTDHRALLYDQQKNLERQLAENKQELERAYDILRKLQKIEDTLTTKIQENKSILSRHYCKFTPLAQDHQSKTGKLQRQNKERNNLTEQNETRNLEVKYRQERPQHGLPNSEIDSHGSTGTATSCKHTCRHHPPSGM